MKAHHVILIAVILTAGCGSRDTFTWQDVSLDQAFQLAGNRMVMVDFIMDN